MAAIPQDLLDEIRDLKRRLRAIEGRAHIRPALNQVIQGDVTIGEGGTLKVEDADGSAQFFLGGISPAHPDGSPQRGLLIYREDGSLALQVAGDGDSFRQTVAIRDADGRFLFAEDEAGGARYPRMVMLPPQSRDSGTWPSTSSSSWTIIARSYNTAAQPRLRMLVRTASDASTTGEVRLRVHETVWGPTVTAPADLDHSELVETPLGSLMETEIEARVTSGTGRVYAITEMMHGLGS